MSFTMNDLVQQDWFIKPSSRKIIDILTSQGKEARFIGGCVRDALVGREVSDIDIATQHVPEEVIKLCEAAEIKVLPTGIDHGTVTAMVEGQAYEITTLRADVETDGRHAVVAFSESWEEDARRRDFTFNALSLDGAGNLHDFCNGLDDLRTGRVRFIGEPVTRIREDYLRILRFFRFSAVFSKAPVDALALLACRQEAQGLSRLSGERIAKELLSLLITQRPAKWLNLMIRYDILQVIVPEVQSGPMLEMLCAFEDQPDALRRFGVLLPDQKEAVWQTARRLRLSKAQTNRLLAMRGNENKINPMMDEDTLRCFLYRNGAQASYDQLLLYWAEKDFSGLGPREQKILDLIAQWRAQPVRFPLQGKDLLEQGVEAGPKMGEMLQEIESWWCKQGCRADRDACIRQLRKNQSGE